MSYVRVGCALIDPDPFLNGQTAAIYTNVNVDMWYQVAGFTPALSETWNPSLSYIMTPSRGSCELWLVYGLHAEYGVGDVIMCGLWLRVTTSLQIPWAGFLGSGGFINDYVHGNDATW